MIKFEGFKFKNLSKQNIKLYGVFCKVPPDALEEYQKHFSLNTMEDKDRASFISSNYLLTVVSNEDEFNNYILYYYAQKNIDHFKGWCLCHDYEGDIKNPKAVADYYNQTISEETGDFLHDLSICTWSFTAPEIAHILRCFYKCMPVGSPNEYLEEHEVYINALEEQIKNTVKDVVENMSAEEVGSFLSEDMKNKIKMIEKTKQSRADNNFDEEDDRR